MKTQFAINVTKAGKGTRMSANDTQNNNNYLDMANVRLFTLATTPAASQNVTADIKLAKPSDVGLSQSSHIYSDVLIPVNTTNFLFYSTRDNLANNATTGAINGSLFGTGSISGTDDINFTGVMIKTAKAAEITAVQDEFANYLNGIMDAFVGATDANLTNAKTKFTSNFTNEQRAGSAFAVLRQVEQLYRIADGSSDAKAENIKAAIINASGTIKTTPTTADGVTTLAYDGIDVKYSNFPEAQDLPEGAMLLTYNTSGKFVYTQDNPDFGIGAGVGPKVNMNKIMYPLPIVYFDNTPVQAKDESLLKNQWPTNTTNWDNFFDASWGNTVLASTHSIALQNNINYGVAGLKTTVQCGSNQLKDNAQAYPDGGSTQNIDVPAEGFPVTGVLVGGQPFQVGWEMIDATTSDPNRDYVIYDNKTNSAVAKNGTFSDPIYTLVFDNWHGVNQEGVNIAIELENNSGKAFYGQDGMIEKGQKFYMIGQLILDDTKKESLTWPTGLKPSYNGRYPVKANDAGKRIFIQDYTTEAKFTINSLVKSYVTIPDLRATKLQLGLSVDLEWKAGMTFDVSID